jgi:Secreted protein containing C-terminal beta-propeller domain distantly related to WD-40 repeats
MKLINLILLSGLMLGGCGGSKDPIENEDDTTPEPPKVDYSQLKETPQTDGALKLATPSLLDSHIKNGIRLQLASLYPPPTAGGSNSSSGGLGSSSGGSFSSSNSSSSGAIGQPTDPEFTDTNVHVAGVDEADWAKYDGRHWYVATRPVYPDYFSGEQPGIQIAATDPANASLEVVGHIALEPDWGTIDEMYLVQEDGDTTHLAVIRKQTFAGVSSSGGFFSSSSSSSSGFFSSNESSSSGGVGAFSIAISSSSSSSSSGLPYPEYYQPRNGLIRVQLVDVEDPALPRQDWAITLDGNFVDSRRIGDVLYLVTRFNPWISGLQPSFLGDAANTANEKILANTPVTALLPHYDLGDGEKPLTTNCYIQDGVNQQMGHAGIINITAIDLKNQKLIGSQCMNGTTDTISMSLESLYLTGSVYLDRTKTVIHKFSFGEDGPAYEASGSVEGHITGRGDPAFRLHEHEGDLRIVTTSWGIGPVHQLFILSQSGDELEVVAQLPNSAQPDPIGKPGEDIYSVRFEAERAYIVTFQQTDPLYAIDLSDRLAPKILGELEIPGFATYMHPLNSRYMFTFGRDADEFGQAKGLKAELIDTGDGTPKSVGTILIGIRFSYSDALDNLKALSLLKVSDDEWRIALPVNVWGVQDDLGIWQYTGLQLFSVTGLAGDFARLTDAGVLKTETAEDNFFYDHGVSRSVLHGDAVFFAHNNAFWSAFWYAPEQAEGPKVKQ